MTCGATGCPGGATIPPWWTGPRGPGTKQTSSTKTSPGTSGSFTACFFPGDPLADHPRRSSSRGPPGWGKPPWPTSCCRSGQERSSPPTRSVRFPRPLSGWPGPSRRASVNWCQPVARVSGSRLPGDVPARTAAARPRRLPGAGAEPQGATGDLSEDGPEAAGACPPGQSAGRKNAPRGLAADPPAVLFPEGPPVRPEASVRRDRHGAHRLRESPVLQEALQQPGEAEEALSDAAGNTVLFSRCQRLWSAGWCARA